MSGWKSWNRHLDSPRHPLVQAVRRLLRSSRARREQGLLVVEGPRLVEEALRAGAGVQQLFVAEQPHVPAAAEAAGGPLPWERLEQLLELAHERGAELIRCGPRVMAAITDTEHPQGVVAVVRLPHAGGDFAGAPPRRWRRGLALLVDGVQDPGNAGTLVRSACGAGADGVVFSWDSADPYGPKALRASAGAVFRLQVLRLPPGQELAQQAKALRSAGWTVAALQPRDGVVYHQADLTRPVALVVGREGEGLRPWARSCCQLFLSVPLQQGLESLNAAVAASVVLFEAARQRWKLSRGGSPPGGLDGPSALYGREGP